MRLYLDSSVLVAAYAPEQFSLRAVELLGTASELVVSELTVTEARVSLIRKRKRQAMTAADVADAFSEIAEAIQDGTISVKPVPVNAHRAAEALADRVMVPVRAMDALHVAMAALLGAELATFGADQATAARAEGITVHTEKI